LSGRKQPYTLNLKHSNKNTMKVTIDGQAIEVEPGTTILQAARMIGGESATSNVLLL
jgi:hypothetical protein